MNKIIFLVITLFAVVLVACGGGSEATTPTQEGVSPPPVAHLLQQQEQDFNKEVKIVETPDGRLEFVKSGSVDGGCDYELENISVHMSPRETLAERLEVETKKRLSAVKAPIEWCEAEFFVEGSSLGYNLHFKIKES
jgi:hypothetical protein